MDIILGYKDLFDDEPESIDSYLNGIDKKVLIDKAINYCSLSTIIGSDVNKILWAFFNTNDINTEFYETLNTKIPNILKTLKGNPKILNVRSSLKFFELIQGRNLLPSTDLSDYEIRQRLLNVYLLINSENKSVPYRENICEHFTAISLNFSVYSYYSGTKDISYLRLAELIKSCIFLEYCKVHIPYHFEVFLNDYGIGKWQEYTLYLHEIENLVAERDIEHPVMTIRIPTDDKNYAKKTAFFDKFCRQGTYHDDADFTEIKSHPVVKNNETGEYRIVFEQFFIEKMYKSLYFTFNAINDSLKVTTGYKKKFRSDIGLEFSEKVLMNRILKDALGNKYKQLNHEELPREGSPDYYIRDDKYILLFECKDNLIDKKIVENGDINGFIEKMKDLYIINKNERPKAIKQLINNIVSIRKGGFAEDKGIDPDNNVIYPILITHNTIFSLSGVNALIDEWFSNELDSDSRDFNKNNIKHITIININTLVLYQGLLSQKGSTIRELIDSYWKNYMTCESKKHVTAEAELDEYGKRFQSFDKYVSNALRDKNIFTKEISKYNQYFH